MNKGLRGGALLLEIYDAFPKEIRDFIKEYEHQGDTEVLFIESMLYGRGMSTKAILDYLKRTVEKEENLKWSFKLARASTPSPPQTKNWQQSLQKNPPSISIRLREEEKSP